jgi:hypothetical protein
LKEVQEVQQHGTAGKADEMLIQEANRHEKLRRTKGSSGWDLGHGPDQLQVTIGGIAEPCVQEEDTTWMRSKYMEMALSCGDVEGVREARICGLYGVYNGCSACVFKGIQ